MCQFTIYNLRYYTSTEKKIYNSTFAIFFFFLLTLRKSFWQFRIKSKILISWNTWSMFVLIVYKIVLILLLKSHAWQDSMTNNIINLLQFVDENRKYLLILFSIIRIKLSTFTNYLNISLNGMFINDYNIKMIWRILF